VHLLPGFDEYLLGYTDRSAQLVGEYRNTIVPGGNGLFMPTIVVDGEVIGIWRRDRKAKRIVVTLQPLKPLSAATLRAVRKKLDRYAEFVETDVELVD
jgi:hypothetical protein